MERFKSQGKEQYVTGHRGTGSTGQSFEIPSQYNNISTNFDKRKNLDKDEKHVKYYDNIGTE